MKMPAPITEDSDHEAIQALLPWFVNNTLDADKQAKIAGHVQFCQECQREVSFLTSVNETVQNDVQSRTHLQSNVDSSFANVMARIDTESSKNSVPVPGSFFVNQTRDKLIDLFTTLTTPQWAATAMAGLLVAVIAIQLLPSQSDEQYSVLSSADNGELPMRLSVEINNSIDDEQFRTELLTLLGSNGQAMEIESEKSGAYVLVFKKAVGVAELSQIITNLESETHIKRVEVLP